MTGRKAILQAPLLAITVLLLLPIAGIAGQQCGEDVECRVTEGVYRIEMPKDGDARGVLVYFHGFKSSAKLQMQQRYLIETALSHHLAYVAVDGIDGSWSHPNAPVHRRDEQRFIESVLNDLRDRYGFNADRTIISGFSIGASMAWYTACQQGDRIDAIVTFSGVFWDPLPKSADCAPGLPKMIHFHGTEDETFPLDGRAIGSGYRQGSVLESTAIYRESARCDTSAGRTITIDGIVCEDVTGCLRGDSILCIHKGGHEARADLLDAGLNTIGYLK